MKKAFSVLLVFLIFVLCVGCDAEKAPCEQHSYAENWQITREATCFEAGEAKRQCENCDAIETKTLDALSHIWGDWTVTTAPSCEEEGVETRTCELCDSNEERSIVPIGHVFGEWMVTREASCSEMGQRVMACEYCDHALTEDIPKTEHTFGDWNQVVISTCEKPGSDERVCGVCNATETKIVPQKEHDKVGVRCDACNQYVGPAAMYGYQYFLGVNFSVAGSVVGSVTSDQCYIEVKNCVQTKTATGMIYTIFYSAVLPSMELYAPTVQNGKHPGLPFTIKKVYQGTLALYCDDGKYYTGEMKTSHCDITVPEGVKVLGLEYVDVIYIHDTSNEEKVTYKPLLSDEGKYYWLIPEE